MTCGKNLCLVLGIVLISACASSSDPAIDAEAAELGLEPVSGRGLGSVSVRSGVDFSRYARVKIEPLEVSFDDTPRSDPMHRRPGEYEFDEEEMDYFNERFVKAVSNVWLKRQGWELTEETGDDVVILQTRIEDLYLHASIKKHRVGPNHALAGETSRMIIHAQLVDGANGDTVMMSRTRKTTGDSTSSPGSMRMVTSVRYWADAHIAFEQWASSMARQFN
ncbi:MAG: DUF3313 domain-containing protein [bacterium]|nr:DUF3313 domain-containing protein [bacterium]